MQIVIMVTPYDDCPLLDWSSAPHLVPRTGRQDITISGRLSPVGSHEPLHRLTRCISLGDSSQQVAGSAGVAYGHGTCAYHEAPRGAASTPRAHYTTTTGVLLDKHKLDNHVHFLLPIPIWLPSLRPNVDSSPPLNPPRPVLDGNRSPKFWAIAVTSAALSPSIEPKAPKLLPCSRACMALSALAPAAAAASAVPCSPAPIAAARLPDAASSAAVRPAATALELLVLLLRSENAYCAARSLTAALMLVSDSSGPATAAAAGAPVAASPVTAAAAADVPLSRCFRAAAL
eukprot:GHUV01028987.1.p1 GENE.GHUV01028987.1~~GHUV01028987.1.p1  ORF type:complete len:288 (-),score=60.58 GHUV01028987.1:409-1272(-)